MNHDYCDDGEYTVNGIRFMNFRILSSDEIQRHAVVKVSNSILYDGLTNNPSKHGLLDRRLGLLFFFFSNLLLNNFIDKRCWN